MEWIVCQKVTIAEIMDPVRKGRVIQVIAILKEHLLDSLNLGLGQNKNVGPQVITSQHHNGPIFVLREIDQKPWNLDRVDQFSCAHIEHLQVLESVGFDDILFRI